MDPKNTVSNGISASIVREIASFIVISRGQEFDLSRTRKAGFTRKDAGFRRHHGVVLPLGRCG